MNSKSTISRYQAMRQRMALMLSLPLFRVWQRNGAMKQGAALGRKTIIVAVLGTGIVAAALAGVPHHRAAIIGQAILQNLVTTTPAAGGPANSSKAEPAAGTAATSATTAAARAIVVPAGTTLIVRLGEELGSRISQVGQSFSATLDREVVVDGQIVIAAGARVNGNVAFARPAGTLVAAPNLQLKLTSVSVNNADLAVVTSIRSFGPAVKGKKKMGRFIKGLLKRASIGCKFTASSEICEDLIRRTAGKEKEVLLADQSDYNFTLRQPLQIR